MYIDAHVHCRDGKQAHKETIAHALSVAERAGFSAIFDMPNTDPPIYSSEQARERIRIAHEANSPVWYGVYLGITSDRNQIRAATEAYNTIDEVVGFKLYAGHSTGNLGVVSEDAQKFCYKELADAHYHGVLVVHCEKESLIDRSKFDPSKPWTHCLAQPPEAEVESLQDQIRFAHAAHFQGTLHVAHVSVPKAVRMVREANVFMRATCGTTPHHLVLSEEDMKRENGILYKMNPPLRPKAMVEELRSYLSCNWIDWIETDHAPHTLDDKFKKHASGVPGLAYYPRLIRDLARKDKLSEIQLKKITFDNAKRVFGRKLEHLKPRVCTPDMNLSSEYPFNPYKPIEEQLTQR